MSTKTNLLVDTAILAAFLVAFEPALTGIAVHEWLSVAFAGTLILHMVLHWDWVVNITIRFFRKLFHASRLNYIVDFVLLVAFVMVMLSGILISRSVLTVLGIQLAASPTWRFLHSTSADLVLWMVGLHFALHWKWIVSTCKRYVVDPMRRMFAPNRMLQPARVPVTSSGSVTVTRVEKES
jgi:hypothetical protein